MIPNAYLESGGSEAVLAQELDTASQTGQQLGQHVVLRLSLNGL